PRCGSARAGGEGGRGAAPDGGGGGGRSGGVGAGGRDRRGGGSEPSQRTGRGSGRGPGGSRTLGRVCRRGSDHVGRRSSCAGGFGTCSAVSVRGTGGSAGPASDRRPRARRPSPGGTEPG